MGAAAMLLEVDGCPARSAREHRRDVAIGLAEFRQQVTGTSAMDRRRSRGERLPAIRNRRQRRVVDHDERGGVLGDVARARDHHRHRFSDKGDFVPGENKRRDVGWKLRGAKLQRQPLLRQERSKIGEREYRMDAGDCARGARINAGDGGVGVGTADERRLQHVGKAQVRDETARAREQRAVFDTRDGTANIVSILHASPRSTSNHIAYDAHGRG
jgi:hypothetical protein